MYLLDGLKPLMQALDCGLGDVLSFSVLNPSSHESGSLLLVRFCFCCPMMASGLQMPNGN